MGMSKIVYVGVAFTVLFCSIFPLMWYITGQSPPPGLFDENDKVEAQLAKWAFKNNELAQGMINRSTAFMALTLPTIAVAPRWARIAPCLFMVYQIMYCNTYVQNKLLFEATGQSNPAKSTVIHSIMSLV